MDVLYYWKNVKEDRKAGNIGWFKSEQNKLAELHESAPDHIWLVKTPEGRKGEITLLGKVKWSDHPIQKPAKADAKSMIYYDANAAASIWFEPLDDAVIAAASQWISKHFPKAVAGNFQGDNGIQALRGEALRELKTLAEGLPSQAFITAISAKAIVADTAGIDIANT